MNQIQKLYFIDTSTILENVGFLKKLSQNNTNKLFISDTVLEEIDRKKDDFKESDAKFQARSFSRAVNNDLDRALSVEDLPEEIRNINSRLIKEKHIGHNGRSVHDSYYLLIAQIDNEKIELIVINRENYKTPIESVKKDAHILEILKDYNLELIVNDILFKTIVKTKNFKASAMKYGEVPDVEKIKFLHTVKEPDLKKLDLEKYTDSEQFIIQEVMEADEINPEIIDGKQKFAIVKNGQLEYLDFSSKARTLKYTGVAVPPINREQDFLFYGLTDTKNKIFVITGATGSGKTLMALQAALSIVRDKRNLIDGIVYTRNTVDAVDKEAKTGYRKGGEEEKIGVFMYPLNNAINLILKKKKSKKDEDDYSKDKKSISFKKNEETSEFMSENNIETLDMATARGITFVNQVVIIDEVQNMSDATLKLMGTRIGENSIVIFLGDIKQNDNLSLTKERNALATLLKLAKEHNNISAYTLEKTIRSETAEFFDKYL